MPKHDGFQALEPKFVLVRVDTTNGSSPLCLRLSVTRNNAYFLFLDPDGNEVSRLMIRGGARSRAPDMDRIVATMQAVLAAPKGSPRLERMIELLADPEPAVRGDAAAVLGKLGADAAKAVPTLAGLLDDRAGSPTVAWHVVWALGHIGPPSLEAVAKLTNLVEDDKRPVNERQAALIALGKIDVKGDAILPVIERALGGKMYMVIGAAIATRNLGEAAAPLVPALIKAFKRHETRAARAYLAEALGAIGPKAKEALPLLRAAAAAPRPDKKDGTDAESQVHNASLGFDVEGKAKAAVTSLERDDG